MKDFSKASTGIYLDTRRKKKDESYPVKIRVTHERVSKYYTTKISMSQEEFNKVMDSRSKGDFKSYRNELIAAEQRAIEVIKSLEEFSYEDFERYFLNKNGNTKDLLSSFQEKIESLEKENKFGSALSYQNAMNSLKGYYGRVTLPYKVVTPIFLSSYERWMLERGKSETTVGFYLRCVRYLFNRAIKRGDINDKLYPFGRTVDGKYEIPQPRNIKKALKSQDLKKLFEYNPEEKSKEEYYRDLWIFSYLCNGINMKDIGLLKYSDIDNDRIYFRRAKTKTSSRKSKPIEIFISPKVEEIINRWGNIKENQDTYIFPIINEKMDEKQAHKRVKSVTRMMNKKLKSMAKELGISIELTTYTARHSYATMLKRKGAPNSLIGDNMGHSNIKTTENYFDSFEDDDKKKWAETLMEFN